MTAGALSLAACGGTEFETPTGMPQGDTVSSNGGFVVEKGDYYYFINGIESYTADNTYGTPRKGALYRIKKSDVQAKNNAAERVVPSLITSGTFDAGIYIYGDRVYYTTPNDVPDAVSGELDTSYMYFKSAKLDGTDIKDYFVLENNATPYRVVEQDGTVYILYVSNNDLYSYNTAKDEKTLLADNTTSYVFNKQDLTDPTVYYTMSVSENQDSDLDPRTFSYNQVYRVRADATSAPYTYTWDQEYIDKELDGEMPYTNLGEIVLDGRAKNDAKTQFNHSATEPTDWRGYTYTLRSYDNGGLYFTSAPAKRQSGSTVGDNDNGQLYYVDANSISTDATKWDSVAVNTDSSKLLVIADSVNLSDTATTSALFYKSEDGKHHYLYVKNSTIFRADVDTANGSHTADQAVAYEVSGAKLVSVDLTTSEKYDYLYFTRSNGAGHSVERAVINGDPVYYQSLPYGDNDNTPYQPVKVLNIEHADSWYEYELIGTDLFFADADSDVASTSFNYVYTVSLANGDGKLMDNVELKAFTDKYNSIMSTDAKVGLLAKLSSNSNSKLSTALRYYFMTGKTDQFEENIEFAVENGQKDTYLYTDDEKDAFYAFNGNKGYTDSNGKELFKESDFVENGTSYRTYSYFATKLGETTEADDEAVKTYWQTTLANYTLPEEEATETGLPGWAWALIGVSIAIVVVAAAGVVCCVILSKKKAAQAPVKERMAVDTTDDTDVDVYATEAPEAAETPAAPAEAEEVPQEEVSEEAPEEVPAETSAESDEAPEAPEEDPTAASEETAPEEAPAAAPEESAPEKPEE